MVHINSIFNQNRLLLLVPAVLLTVLLWWGSVPRLFVQGETELIACVPARQGANVNISFIHSVQKTPVEEYLVVSDDLSELVLRSTRYHSFGVGLPFMASDGNFYQDGNDFVMDNMERHFSSLSLRTGVGTKLTVTIDGESYPLYEKFSPGYRVDIFTAPGIYYLKALLESSFKNF